MSFTPQKLLSNAVREKCLSTLKELPSYFGKDPKPSLHAAVLVPLCVNNSEVCLLYTLRSSNLNSHSGQISFPGGKLDNNETVYEAAVRETEEEIGINCSEIDIWGKMPQVQGREGAILITPVVGLIKDFDVKKLHRNPDEVEEIFTVPISDLCDRNSHGNFEFNNFFLPVYLHKKHKIWGITGLITHMFLQSLLPEKLYDFNFYNKKYTLDELMPSKL